MAVDYKPDPLHPGKHINPETGIWPISEWGWSCGRGFVSNERFSTKDAVLKRGNKSEYRKHLTQQDANRQKSA